MQNSSPILSVIVPVYNTESYLTRCLDSILNQTFKDMEIICIDDGSSDNSLAILQSYTEKYEQIKIISQINSGQAVARNAALDIAKGKYIGFVDSDDWLDDDFYEKLLAAAQATNAEIVMAGTRWIEPQKNIEIYPKQNATQKFAQKLRQFPNGAVWDKIFDTAMLRSYNLQFLPNVYYEDNWFLALAAYYSRKAVFINTTFYNYFQNPKGTSYNPSGQMQEKRHNDRYFVASELLKFADEKKIDGIDLYQLKDFISRSILPRPHDLKAKEMLGKNFFMSRNLKKHFKLSFYKSKLKTILTGFNK